MTAPQNLPTPGEMLAEAIVSANNAVMAGGNMTTWLEHGRLLLDIAKELREGTPTDSGYVTPTPAWSGGDRVEFPGSFSADATTYGDQAAGRTSFLHTLPEQPARDYDPARTEIIHMEQPMPTPNGAESIQAMVRHDLNVRERVGIQRYGTSLQPDNGRDALRDLYEELLDAACYAKQLMVERDG